MRRKIFVINILFTLLLFEAIFPFVVKKYNIMTLSRYGVVEQDEFRTKSANTIFNFPEEYNKKFIDLIKDKIDLNTDAEQTIERAIKIREQFLNLAERTDTSILVSRYPDKLLHHMLSNKSLLCGELARLYGYILHLSGFTVRYITISRSIFDAFDRHSFIEVWDDKRQKWIITDPTFNISYKNHSDFLSSDEVYDLIHSGHFDAIKIINGNPTRYEYKIYNSNISIFSLFDNVYLVKDIQHFTVSEIPPFRWFNKNFRVYLLQSKRFPVFGTGIKIQNSIVFFVLFLFPVIILVIIFYFLFFKFTRKLISKRFFVEVKPICIKITKKFNK
jgi:glutaredoxin 2